MVECLVSQSNKNESAQKHLSKLSRLDSPRQQHPQHAEVIRDLMAEHIVAGAEDAFYIADMGAVVRQHRQWQNLLPRISPFYAVKCNNNPEVLRTLLSLGTGFDCASRGEIETMLAMGADPSRLIYANPCKQASHIRFARDHGVRRMTFDNASELYKVHQHYPDAEMVLRVLTDDSRSICKLGTKFGCRPENTRALLETAKSLSINVIGVSFHVGSGCRDRLAFVDAVQRARRVFDEGTELGFHFTLLDVGGGFPGAKQDDEDSTIGFTDIVQVLRPAVDQYFPMKEMSDLEVIAEPGRYYVAAAFSLAVCITSRRVISTQLNEANAEKLLQLEGTPVTDSEMNFMYYVNDGVYGSFNCLLFDHATVTPQVLARQGSVFIDGWQPSTEKDSLFGCSVWGPTCDSMDCLTKTARLPEMEIGDWFIFDNMGAYTVAAASCFNGFNLSRITYINTEDELSSSSEQCSSEDDMLSTSSMMMMMEGNQLPEEGAMMGVAVF